MQSTPKRVLFLCKIEEANGAFAPCRGHNLYAISGNKRSDIESKQPRGCQLFV